MTILTAIRTSAIAILFCYATHAFCETPPDPSQLKDTVIVKLGESKKIMFHTQGDQLTEPKVTSQPDEKQPGVSLEFTLNEGVRMLSIQNGFSRGLRFRCLARLEGRKEYVESATHPLFPNFFSTEAFGDPVEELILFEFKLTDDKLPQ
jgi:hypothetical protein